MFYWQQKMNYENKWSTVGEYPNLRDAQSDMTKFKTQGISHSGRTGTYYLQQRIINENGQTMPRL